MKHASKAGEMGVQYSIVKPRGFREAQWFSFEKVREEGRIKSGERLDLFIGGMRISVMAHSSQPACRVTITRLGRRRFQPTEVSERQDDADADDSTA